MGVAEPIFAPWKADLSLGFRFENDRTVLAEKSFSGPLVVQKPLYPGRRCRLPCDRRSPSSGHRRRRSVVRARKRGTAIGGADDNARRRQVVSIRRPLGEPETLLRSRRQPRMAAAGNHRLRRCAGRHCVRSESRRGRELHRMGNSVPRPCGFGRALQQRAESSCATRSIETDGRFGTNAAPSMRTAA